MTLARSFTGFGRIPPEEGLNPAELAVVDELSTYLASRDAVNAGVLPVALRTRMESLGLSRRAIIVASRLILEPPLTGRNRWGAPARAGEPTTIADPVPMVRRVAGDEPTWRARYLLQAAKRLTDADDFAPALAKERRYLRLHRQAGVQRRAGAMQADQARKRSRTGLLIWQGGTCPECAPRDGTVLMPGEQLPPIHPNCLIGSSRISATLVVARDESQRLPDHLPAFGPAERCDRGPLAATTVAEAERDFGRRNIRAVTIRDYVGDVLTIVTASGKELTGTPNHPIATPGGWIALAELHVGMDILSSTDVEWEVDSVHPDEDDVPPTIEQVAQTFPVVLDPMPTAAQDFHGDGAGSEVHVVLTDGLLRDDIESLCPEHLAERLLSRRDADPKGGLPSAGRSLKLVERHLSPAHRIVSCGRHVGALLRRGLAHAKRRGDLASPNLNTSAGKDPSEGRAADSDGICERLQALPGFVSADQIVNVWRRPFAGHVYNLETVDGWYIGNGIITHNCRCFVRPF